jgi:adenosylhomocysteinase
MVKYKIKDISLSDKGKIKIEFAEKQMPVLLKIREEFKETKPFKGLTLGLCLHNTRETAVLVKTLKAGGAEVALCAANPLSTQDDVVAALVQEGINVFSWAGETNDEYYWCINQVLDFKPNITIDDGADLVTAVHTKRTELVENIIGGTEETTTGIIRLRSMEKDGVLKYPIIAVNDARSKNLFDNYYGTGESTLDGILRATHVLLPGKTIVVCGYGNCGQGVATMAKGLGAHTIVCEVDPVKALKAYYDGHSVMSMEDAASKGDIFITVTGCKDVIAEKHMIKMKSGAILANSGHFNVEINVNDLKRISKSERRTLPNVDEYTLPDGRKLYLLGEGRIVNLVCAEGHPSEVMDQSFSLQALAAEYIVKNKGKLEKKVYNVLKETDDKVASLKLEALNVKIDTLTKDQIEYLQSWQAGTS